MAGQHGAAPFVIECLAELRAFAGNGLSQAVGYGDDYAAATNYPLARITNRSTGTVRCCRTANHTTAAGAGSVPSMGVATGAAIVTTEVTIPADLELGESDMVIVANRIPSAPVTVVVQPQGQEQSGDG